MITVAILFAAAVIVFMAARIMLGWIVPAPLLARIDRVVNQSANLILQLAVIGIAGLILFVIWFAAYGS